MSRSASSPGTHARRSLADELRTWDDGAIATLLQARPDLAVPLPRDLAALAHRATQRPSVQLAVDGLDLAALQVLESVAALPDPVAAQQVGAAWGADARPQLERLRALGLVWGGVDRLILVRAARDCLGPHPAGLGPPLGPPAAQWADPDRLGALLEQAPDGVRVVLDRLAWDGPLGRLPGADREPDAASARPLDWLLARGLLASADADHVVLPREIALALRGGRTHRTPGATRPEPATRSAADADHRAGRAAAEAVRLVEALIHLWGATPPAVLRSGGLGVRELRRTSAGLEVDVAVTARIVEIAHAAGLIADDGEIDPHWLPTPDADLWLAREVPQRWTALAQAYLATARCPHLVGERDARGAVHNALGPELTRSAAPQVRAWLLRTLAAVPAGLAVGVESLTDQLTWSAPRRATATRLQLLRSAVAEGTWLGLLGTGPGGHVAVAGYARAWPEAAEPPGPVEVAARAGAELAALLPDPVDHVLLQADLTAVAPGPLDRRVERELDLLADVESRGGATVFRFSPESVRRALDAGRGGDDVLAWLREHSRTPVPQPLEYLVADAARRHGRLRVGTAHAFVRSDDEAVLNEVLADRRAGVLRLRRLAPTVLAAQADPGTVLEVLRAMGLSPAAEGPDGATVLAAPPVRRTGSRRRTAVALPTPPSPGRRSLLAAAAALRSADEPPADEPAGEPAGGDPPADVATVIIQLERAMARRAPVWVAYVDGQGRLGQALVEPIEVTAGRLSAFDRRAARIVTLPIARVRRVSPARV